MIPDGLRLFIDIFGGVAPSKDPWDWDLDGVAELGKNYADAADSLNELLPEFNTIIHQTEKWYEGHGGEAAATSLKQLTDGKYSIHHLVKAMEAVPEFTSQANASIVGDRITESLFAAWGAAEFARLAAEVAASGGLLAGFAAAEESIVVAIGRITFARARAQMMSKIEAAAARMLGEQLLLRGLSRMGLEGLEKFMELAFKGLGSGLKLAGVGAGITAGVQLASGQDLDLAKIGDAAAAWGFGGIAGHVAGGVFGPAATRIGLGRMAPVVSGFATGLTTAVAIGALHSQWDMFSLGYMGGLGAVSGARGGMAATRHANAGSVPLDMAGRVEMRRLEKEIEANLAVSDGLPTPDFREKLDTASAHNDIQALKTLQYQAHDHAVQHPGDGTAVVVKDTGTPQAQARGQATPPPPAAPQTTTVNVLGKEVQVPVEGGSTSTARVATGPASGGARAWGGIDAASPAQAGRTATPDAGGPRASSEGASAPPRAQAGAAPESGARAGASAARTESAAPAAGVKDGTAPHESGKQDAARQRYSNSGLDVDKPVKEGTAARAQVRDAGLNVHQPGAKEEAAAGQRYANSGFDVRKPELKEEAAARANIADSGVNVGHPEGEVRVEELTAKEKTRAQHENSAAEPTTHEPSKGLRRRLRAYTRALSAQMRSEIAIRDRLDTLAPEPEGTPERPVAERFREWEAAERARLERVGTDAQAAKASKMLDEMVTEFEAYEKQVTESDHRLNTAKQMAEKEVCSTFDVKPEAVDSRGLILVATENWTDHFVKVELLTVDAPGGLRTEVRLHDSYEVNAEAYNAAREPLSQAENEYRQEVTARVGERVAETRTLSELVQRIRRYRAERHIAEIRAAEQEKIRQLQKNARHDLREARANEAAAQERLAQAQQRLRDAAHPTDVAQAQRELWRVRELEGAAGERVRAAEGAVARARADDGAAWARAQVRAAEEALARARADEGAAGALVRTAEDAAARARAEGSSAEPRVRVAEDASTQARELEGAAGERVRAAEGAVARARADDGAAWARAQVRAAEEALARARADEGAAGALVRTAEDAGARARAARDSQPGGAREEVAQAQSRDEVAQAQVREAQARAEVREAQAQAAQAQAKLREQIAEAHAEADAAVAKVGEALEKEIGAERRKVATEIANERIAAIEAVKRERMHELVQQWLRDKASRSPEEWQRIEELRKQTRKQIEKLRQDTRERLAELWRQSRGGDLEVTREMAEQALVERARAEKGEQSRAQQTLDPEQARAWAQAEARRQARAEMARLQDELAEAVRREEQALMREIAPDFLEGVAREEVAATGLIAAERIREVGAAAVGRQEAAEAAGRALERHYQALTAHALSVGIGIRLASDEVLTHMLHHGSPVESRMAITEILRRTTAQLEGGDGKALRWTQYAAGEAMRYGPVNQDAGEGKSMMYHAFLSRLAAEKGSVQYVTKANLVDREFQELVAAFGHRGYKIIRINPDEVMPEPVAGEPTIYIGDISDVVVSRLRGHPVPSRNVVIDEIDEAMIYGNSTYIISDGVKELAPAHIEAQVRGAADFLKDAVRNKLLTREDFGRELDQKEGPTHLTEEGQKKIEAYLTEQRVIEAEAQRGAKLTPLEREQLAYKLSPEERHRLDMAATARWEYIRGKHYIVVGEKHRLELGEAGVQELVAEDGQRYQFTAGPDGRLANGRLTIREGQILIIDQVTHKLMADKDLANESRWNNGLAQAIEAKHKLEIRNDSDHSQSLTIGETFTKENYDLKSGASGTAKAVSGQLDKLGLGKTTAIDRFAPSRLNDGKPAETTFSMTEQGRDQAIVAETESVYHGTENPVAIFVHDNRLARKLARMLEKKGIAFEKIDAEQEAAWASAGKSVDAEAERIIGAAGGLKKVTILNMQWARGVDIKLTPEALARGGLHVIVSEHSHLEAVDIQAIYRAARSGQPGTAGFHATRDSPFLDKVPPDHPMAVVIERYKTTEDPLERAVYEQQIRDNLTEIQRAAEAHQLGVTLSDTPAMGATAAQFVADVEQFVAAAAQAPAAQAAATPPAAQQAAAQSAQSAAGASAAQSVGTPSRGTAGPETNGAGAAGTGSGTVSSGGGRGTRAPGGDRGAPAGSNADGTQTQPGEQSDSQQEPGDPTGAPTLVEEQSPADAGNGRQPVVPTVQEGTSVDSSTAAAAPTSDGARVENDSNAEQLVLPMDVSNPPADQSTHVLAAGASGGTSGTTTAANVKGEAAQANSEDQPWFPGLSAGWTAAQPVATPFKSGRLERRMQQDKKMLQHVRRRYALELMALRRRVVQAGVAPAGLAEMNLQQLAGAYGQMVQAAEAELRSRIEQFLGGLEGDLAVPGPIGEGIAGLQAARTNAVLRIRLARAEATTRGEVESGEILAAELQAEALAAELTEFGREAGGVRAAQRQADELLERMTQAASEELLDSLTDQAKAMPLGDGMQLLVDEKAVLVVGANPDRMVDEATQRSSGKKPTERSFGEGGLQPWMKTLYQIETTQCTVDFDGKVWYRKVVEQGVPDTAHDGPAPLGDAQRQLILAQALWREGVTLEELTEDGHNRGRQLARLWPKLTKLEQQAFLEAHPLLVIEAEGLDPGMRAAECEKWLVRAREELAAVEQRDSMAQQMGAGASGLLNGRTLLLRTRIARVENIAAQFTVNRALAWRSVELEDLVADARSGGGMLAELWPELTGHEQAALMKLHPDLVAMDDALPDDARAAAYELLGDVGRQRILALALQREGMTLEELVADARNGGQQIAELWPRLTSFEQQMFLQEHLILVVRAEGLDPRTHAADYATWLALARDVLAELHQHDTVFQASRPGAPGPYAERLATLRSQIEAVQQMAAELAASGLSVHDRRRIAANRERATAIAGRGQDNAALLAAALARLNVQIEDLALAEADVLVQLWQKLNADEREAFIAAHPDVVMRTEGLAAEVRELACFVVLDRKRDELAREQDNQGADPVQVAALLAEIDAAANLAAALAGAAGADPQAVVGDGDVPKPSSDDLTTESDAAVDNRPLRGEAATGGSAPAAPSLPEHLDASLLQAGLYDLVAYGVARREMTEAAGEVRSARELDESSYEDEMAERPAGDGPGPQEQRVRGAAEAAVARLQAAQQRVDAFFDLLGTVLPQGIPAHQRQWLHNFAAAVEQWRAVDDEMADADPYAEGHEALTQRHQIATRRVHAAAQRLATTAELRPVAELDGGWGPVDLSAAALSGIAAVAADSIDPIEHFAIDLDTIVAVTDKGANGDKPHNHDWMLSVVVHTPNGPVRISVVCDGVGSTIDGHRAARDAAEAARAYLERFARQHQGAFTEEDAKRAMEGAIQAAQDAVVHLTETEYADADKPPRTTIAAVMVRPERDGRPGQYTAGGVGDTRVLRLRADGRSEAVTTDHTMAGYLQKTEEELPPEERTSQRELLRDPEAHGIMHSLGVDAGPPAPDDVVFSEYIFQGTLSADDVMVICTDGLWNTNPEADEMAVFLDAGRDTDLLRMRDRMLNRGLLNGGADHTTFTLISGAPAESTPRLLPAPPTGVPIGFRRHYRVLADAYQRARAELWQLAAQAGADPELVASADGFLGEIHRLGDDPAVDRLESAARHFHAFRLRLGEFGRWLDRVEDRAQWTADDTEYLAALSVWSVTLGELREATQTAVDEAWAGGNPGQVAVLRELPNPGLAPAVDDPDVVAATQRYTDASYEVHRTVRQLDDTRSRDGRLEIPAALRRGYRALIAEQRDAREILGELRDALPDAVQQLVGVEDLTGDDHYGTLAALQQIAAEEFGGQDAMRITVDWLVHVTRRFHRAGDRMAALERFIRTHGDGMGSVDAEPRPLVAAEVLAAQAALTDEQRARAVRRWRAILMFAREPADLQVMWDMTDHPTRRALIQHLPEALARTDGLPREVRDEAAKLSLHRERETLRQQTDPDSNRLARANFQADLVNAAQRWAAQVPGHPTVQMTGRAGTLLVIGDLHAAQEIRFHAVDQNGRDAVGTVMRATAAAVDGVAASRRPAAAVVWVGADGAALAAEVAALAEELAGNGLSVPDMVLVGHEDVAPARGPQVEGMPQADPDLVLHAWDDPALDEHRDRIDVDAPEPGVVRWEPSHRLEGVANDCGQVAGEAALGRILAGLEDNPDADPDVIADLRDRLSMLRMFGVPENGLSGPLLAQLLGAGWHPDGFADFDAMAAAVPEGGVMIGAVAFDGFQRRGTVGAHAVMLFRENGRVMVRDGRGPAVAFESWRAGLAGVIGWHGIVINADGSPAVDEDGQSRSMAGTAFPVANIGARLGNIASQGVPFIDAPPAPELTRTRLHAASIDLDARRAVALGELNAAMDAMDVLRGDQTARTDLLTEESFATELNRLAGTQQNPPPGWHELAAHANHYHELSGMAVRARLLRHELAEREQHSPEWLAAAGRFAAALPAWPAVVGEVRDAVLNRIDPDAGRALIRRVAATINPLQAIWAQLARETIDLGSVVGISDRGPVYKNNQDAMAADVVMVGDKPIRFAIVSDGVSVAVDGHRAASVAAAAARKSLREALAAHDPDTSISDELRRQMVADAINAAQAAVMKLTDDEYAGIRDAAIAKVHENANQQGITRPPQATIAVVLVDPGQDGQPGKYTAGWVGDSRINVLDPTDPEKSRTVTFDHTHVGMGMLYDARDAAKAAGSEKSLPQLLDEVSQVVGEAPVSGGGLMNVLGLGTQNADGYGTRGGPPVEGEQRHYRYLTDGEVAAHEILFARTDGFGGENRQASAFARAIAEHDGDLNAALAAMADTEFDDETKDNTTGVAVLSTPSEPGVQHAPDDVLRAGLSDLQTYGRARQAVLNAAAHVRAARELDWRNGHPTALSQGPNEQRAQRVSREAVRRYRELDPTVDALVEQLNPGATQEISARQRHMLVRYGAAVAEWNEASQAMRQRYEDIEAARRAGLPRPANAQFAAGEVDPLARRYIHANRQITTDINLLAADPALRPLAEMGGPWAKGVSLGEVPAQGNSLGSDTIALDRTEIDLGSVSAISDIGAEKSRNEDSIAAMVIETPEGPVRIAVVCDGVSTSTGGHRAAQVAAARARQHLAAVVRQLGPGQRLSPEAAEQAMSDAIHAAQNAVVKMSDREYPGHADPPVTTIAAVMVMPGRDGQPGHYVAGGVGDSQVQVARADGSVQLLTTDHTKRLCTGAKACRRTRRVARRTAAPSDTRSAVATGRHRRTRPTGSGSSSGPAPSRRPMSSTSTVTGSPCATPSGRSSWYRRSATAAAGAIFGPSGTRCSTARWPAVAATTSASPCCRVPSPSRCRAGCPHRLAMFPPIFACTICDWSRNTIRLGRSCGSWFRGSPRSA